MKKALIIEDDQQVAEIVSAELKEMGYQLEHATSGESGLELAARTEFEFVLLDLGLPGVGGLEVCKELRAHSERLPILIVSSRSDELNKVLLLEFGADDYIVKPFSPHELKARIKAVLRRSNRSVDNKTMDEPVFAYKGLSIDFDKRRVTLNGELVQLTAREFDLLALLVSHPGRAFTREELNEDSYGDSGSGYDKSIANHINRIRNKIESDPHKPEFVLTVRGIGYAFSDVEDF